jgi:hypothetical protein
MFEIGEKVVCIDDDVPAPDRGNERTRFSRTLFWREVYAIREVEFRDGYPFVALVGIYGLRDEDGREAMFDATRFRRLAVVQAENKQLVADGQTSWWRDRWESWPKSGLYDSQRLSEAVECDETIVLEWATQVGLRPYWPGVFVPSEANAASDHRLCIFKFAKERREKEASARLDSTEAPPRKQSGKSARKRTKSESTAND